MPAPIAISRQQSTNVPLSSAERMIRLITARLLMRIRGGAAHGLRLQRESALDDDAVAGLYA